MNRNRLNKFMVMALAMALAIAFAVPAVAATKKVSVYKGKPAKYVFYFIGDGMGIPQRAAAEKFLGKKLVMDSMPAQGVTTTFAADRYITGSAAAATALGCGQKTNIGMIGMTPSRKPVKSVAHIAKEQGKKVGVVSSVSIDHATPASFYAHVPKRSQYYDIELQLADSDFDFFGGGGFKDPNNKKKSKNDKGNAFDYAKSKGYKILNDKDAIMALKPSDGKVIAVNRNLPDGKAMPYVLDMTPEDVTLPEFTEKAIEMLDNPKGFFLMVEGGKIDWACHANDAVSAMTNTLAFDNSIQVAMDFMKKHPNDTLIVVTGDHECGGLTLGFAGTAYESYFNALKIQDVSFQKFTDENLKLWSDECTKGCSFEDIKPTITHFFGLKFEGDKKDPLYVKPYQEKMLEAAYVRTMAGKALKEKTAEAKVLYGGYDPLTVSITHILNNNAGIGWTSFKHTAVPVATSAIGVGSASFNGYYDNTDVALKMMSVMGVKPKVYTSDNGIEKITLAAN